MHVLFVEPSFPQNQREFPRALRRAGARVTGIGERAPEYLDSEMREWLHDYVQVPSVCHEASLLEAVRGCQQRGWVDRLEATIESHIMPTAHVRKKCGIPGTSVETSFLCRDKPAMKEALRRAGISCAASTGVESMEEAYAFVKRTGYPVIVKPRDSAGAAGTYLAHNREEFDRALMESRVDHGASAAIEEFIEGHEGFYDTITADGKVVHEFITHYYPNVLEGMRERWISPQFVATNRLDAPGYEQVRQMGLAVIDALGIGTSATHMEWFFGPKGLKFSEIGCRPPGVGAWDVYGAAHEIDVYEEWARAVVGLPRAQRASGRFCAGHIALRPTQDGTIAGYEGLEEFQRSFEPWIVATHFPPPGTPTQPIEAGFKANAWVRLRHPDYDELRRMLDIVGRSVRVIAR